MTDYQKILKDIFIKRQNELEISGDKLSENHDKFIVWIISLSTGAIALLFSTIDKIEFLTTELIAFPVGLFIASILTGVLGRTLSSISSHIGYRLNSLFAFSLRSLEIPLKNRELNGNETAEQIYLYLNTDFNADFPDILEKSKKLSRDELNIFDKETIEFYKDYAMASKRDLDSAMDKINLALLKSYGYSEDYLKKRTSKKSSNRIKGIVMRVCTATHLIFYLLSMSSFVSAIILISIRILKK